MTGIGILILSVYYIVIGSHLWSIIKGDSILQLILDFLGIVVWIMLVGNVLLFDALISLYLYIRSFMLLSTCLIGLFAINTTITKVLSCFNGNFQYNYFNISLFSFVKSIICIYYIEIKFNHWWNSYLYKNL